MFRQSNPKIDIYVSGTYKDSTNWSKTCKEAKYRYLNQYPNLDPNSVKCKKSK